MGNVLYPGQTERFFMILSLMALSIFSFQIFELGQRKLLNIATPESIARLPEEMLEFVWDTYFKRQTHSSLVDYLSNKFTANEDTYLYQVK